MHATISRCDNRNRIDAFKLVIIHPHLCVGRGRQYQRQCRRTKQYRKTARHQAVAGWVWHSAPYAIQQKLLLRIARQPSMNKRENGSITPIPATIPSLQSLNSLQTISMTNHTKSWPKKLSPYLIGLDMPFKPLNNCILSAQAAGRMDTMPRWACGYNRAYHHFCHEKYHLQP